MNPLTFANSITGGDQERPYRSHLQPACLECRKRKARCIRNTDNDVCLHCSVRKVSCVLPNTGDKRNGKRVNRLAAKPTGNIASHQQATKRQRQSSLAANAKMNASAESPDRPSGRTSVAGRTALPVASEQCVKATAGILDGTENEIPHVLAPNSVDDTNGLNDVLLTDINAQRPVTSPDAVARRTGIGLNSVLFTTVRRRPVGHVKHQSCAASKCELIEKIVGPGMEDLVSVFFEQVNSCLPLFDRASFIRNYTESKDKISPAVLCNLYANAMTYWNLCPTLSLRTRPDVMFIWLQANEALNSETFLSPGLSTILAMLLNIGGRPSTSVFGNGGLVGVAVARANALGLNRDPSDWNIPHAEKIARIKVWWLIVMQDRWWSLAYGTPLQINRRQFDVPLPDVAALFGESKDPSVVNSTIIFVALLQLTEVLGQVLEFMYDLSDASRTPLSPMTAVFESLMDSWLDSQDDFVRRIVSRGIDPPVPGAANLRLAYLGLRFLITRLNFSLPSQEQRQNKDSLTLQRIHIRRVAKEVFHFVKELNEADLRGFWLPMHAYTLTSVTSFLIRDALRSDDKQASQSRRIAPEMISILRHYESQYNWDLAENTLTSYGSVVDQLGLEVGGTGNGAANLDIPCMSLPDMEEIFINLDDYVQLEPEDFLPRFQPQVDEELALIAPSRPDLGYQPDTAGYQLQ